MIELGKIYKDCEGNDVRIICVDRKGVYPIVGLINYEVIQCYNENGVEWFSNYNLIIPEDYSTYKIDEPVMVRQDDNSEWDRYYFAGVTDGKPTTWTCGGTSWSATCCVTWSQCRRPTPEELVGNK